eukprot:4717226-Prymnesium_polylepis.1
MADAISAACRQLVGFHAAALTLAVELEAHLRGVDRNRDDSMLVRGLLERVLVAESDVGVARDPRRHRVGWLGVANT